jgi:hypothetical protein
MGRGTPHRSPPYWGRSGGEVSRRIFLYKAASPSLAPWHRPNEWTGHDDEATPAKKYL